MGGKYLDVSEGGKAVGLEAIFPSSPQEAIDSIVGRYNDCYIIDAFVRVEIATFVV
jgi:hypothetical protein